MRIRFHHFIFLGLLLGVLGGIGLWQVEDKSAASFELTLWWLDLFGKTLFIGALKMIVAPLILVSIVAGVTSLGEAGELGRIGWRTLLYYAATTIIAVTIGLVSVHVMKPGEKPASRELRNARAAELEALRHSFAAESGRDAEADPGGFLGWLHGREESAQARGSEAGRWSKLARAEERRPREMIKDDIVEPLLMNPFQSLVTQNSLGIIFFSLLFGMACLVVGRAAQPVASMFQAASLAIFQLTSWIMLASPIAVGCLTASLIATNGPHIFGSLAWYCAAVIAGIALHVIVLVSIAALLGRVRPRALWRGVREPWLIAFTTRSSAATLPVTLRALTERLGISPKIANFVAPLGATVNMDGTALYEGVAVLYLLQIYGGLADVPIAIGGVVTLIIFLTAVLASIGAAAVPDAGLVTMVLVANAVGLPVYYIPLIFAVDAFLDMFRTSTNVLGDVVGCTVLERFEGERLRRS